MSTFSNNDAFKPIELKQNVTYNITHRRMDVIFGPTHEHSCFVYCYVHVWIFEQKQVGGKI